MRPLLVVLLVVAMAGCTDFLDASSDTHLGFMCRAIDGEAAPLLVVHVWGEGFGVGDRLVAQLDALRGAGSARLQVESEPVPLEPEELEAWVGDHHYARGRGVHVHLVWMDEVATNATGELLAPGIVALNRTAVLQAQRTTSEAATGVVMHHVGHALGQVNRGVPIVDRNVTLREGDPGHAAAPGTVMHHDWHASPLPLGGELTWGSAELDEWVAARNSICAR